MSPRAALRCFSVWAVSTLAAAIVGCDADVALSDSVDDVIDFGHDKDADRSLQAPYVVGARFDVRLPEGGDGAALASSDDAILQLAGEGSVAHAIALAPGMVEILVLDEGGEIVGATEVEVRMPTRAILHAAAPVFLDRDDVSTEVARPRILAGGEATFLVEYFDGPTRLAGSGGLEAFASDGAIARTSGELLGERRDWLTIGGAESGIEQVTLAVGGEAFTAIDVDVVDAAVVADLDVFASETSGDRAAPGVVIATGYDLDGEAVYGLGFQWRLANGAEQVGVDIVRYAADTAPMQLVASYGELEGAAAIHADPADADAGCSVTSQRPSAWALVLLVLASLRHRPR